MINFSSRFLNHLLLIISTAIIITIWVKHITSLNTASYILEQSDLYQIDSVKMLSRAFMVGNGKSSPSIEFEDENGKIFSINGPRYIALMEKSVLYDTLQYSRSVISVLTDKEGFGKYHDKNDNSKIDVYDVRFGATSFISLDRINNEEHDRRLSLVILFSIAYGIYLIFYFHHRIKSMKGKTT